MNLLSLINKAHGIPWKLSVGNRHLYQIPDGYRVKQGHKVLYRGPVLDTALFAMLSGSAFSGPYTLEALLHSTEVFSTIAVGRHYLHNEWGQGYVVMHSRFREYTGQTLEMALDVLVWDTAWSPYAVTQRPKLSAEFAP